MPAGGGSIRSRRRSALQRGMRDKLLIPGARFRNFSVSPNQVDLHSQPQVSKIQPRAAPLPECVWTYFAVDENPHQ